MSTIDDAIEILKAMKEGKKIQFLNRAGGWSDRTAPDVLPNFFADTYRIKPEPKEIWVNEYSNGVKTCYSSRKDALRAAQSCGMPQVAVRYREVIE